LLGGEWGEGIAIKLIKAVFGLLSFLSSIS